MDKCREEFEKYCKSKWFINLEVSDEGDYIAPQTRLKFETWCSAWQASRESMKAIKLPNAIKADNRLLGDNEYCSGYNQALRDCEKQITSAGYKVEE